jgi:hypothetical protein
MRRWTARDQPYLRWRWGIEWLAFRVDVAPDLAGRWRRRSWKHKASKGRWKAAFVVSGGR